MEFEQVITPDLDTENPGLDKAHASITYNGLPEARVKKESQQGVSKQHQDQMTVRRQKVQSMWLNGSRATEISMELDVSVPTIHADIRAFRKELYNDNQATLSEHTEQSVSILRRSIAGLHAMEELADNVRELISISTEIRKTEETIAKIRGVLTSSTLRPNIHINEIKLYDFENPFKNMPAPLPADQIIEGEAKVLESPDESMLIPGHPMPQSKEHKPDYISVEPYESSDLLVMPNNGDLVKYKQPEVEDVSG